MSDWLIRRSYGFGVAQVPLCAEPHVAWGTSWSLREGARQARPTLGGLRGALRQAPVLGMGFVIALAPLLAMLQETLDSSDIDLVVMQTAMRPVPPPLPTVPATIEPPPEVVEPPAIEPPVKAAPPPTPPPAKPAAPKPEPVVVVARTPRPPVPPAPPKAIAPEPSLSAPPDRPVASTRSPRTPPPEAPVSGFQPVVRIDAVKNAEPSPVAAIAGRRAAPSRTATPRPSRQAPRFASAAPTQAFRETDAPQSFRQERPTRKSPQAREARARPAALALPDPGAPKLSARPARVAAAPPSRRPPPQAAKSAAPRGRNRPGVVGVPLASLASCVSDREEDELKQRVLAAVGRQSQCESTAGRYVFVETRNLNAFLMYVERAAARGEADRCVELSLALDCLKSAGGGKAERV